MEKQTEKMRKMAAIAALSANYDQVMQKDLMKIWLDLLEEYSASQVKMGVNTVIREYEYKTRPPFAVLRKAIDQAIGKRHIEPEERIKIMAMAEWNRLIDNLSAYGRYNKPELDPTTAYVLNGMGGWDAACSWDMDKIEWRRKDFIESWQMAYGNEDLIALGASGAKEISEGPQSAGDILKAILARHELEEGKETEI